MEFPTPFKRKHNTLTMETKMEILNRLEQGEPASFLARLYDVGKTTISDLKSKRDHIMRTASITGKRKTLKTCRNQELEKSLYLWYSQKQEAGETVTGLSICKMALELNKTMDGPEDFKASNGWLRNFKMRHKILEPQSNKGDENAFQEFKIQLRDFIISNGLTKDDVYNANETFFRWESRNVLDSRIAVDKMCAIFCCNANGTHPLPLLVIGNSVKSHCIKNLNELLPVIYRGQKFCSMTPEVFSNWYSTVFVPIVKKHRKQKGKEGKVLILVDHSFTHQSVQFLENEENFTIMFFPTKSTHQQPINQAMSKTKQAFRKHMAEKCSNSTEKPNIKDACCLVAECWNSLNVDNLAGAWDNLWPITERTNERCNDDEIVKIEISIVDEDENSKEVGPSHAEAFYALETAIKWYDNQAERSLSHLLSLETLKELSAEKHAAELERKRAFN